MADLTRFSPPSEVSLDWDERDTGTINVILPPTGVGIEVCTREGDKFAGPVDPLDDLFIHLEQGNEGHGIGRSEAGDHHFDKWNDIIDERECFHRSTRTDDDSSRIVSQVNEQNEWACRGICPGEVEWVLTSEDGLELAREPGILIGGPPLLSDVSLSISPRLSGRTITGAIEIGNPTGVGVTVELTVTATHVDSGSQFLEERLTESASGSLDVGTPNVTEVPIPEATVPEALEGDIEVCCTGTANGVPIKTSAPRPSASRDPLRASLSALRR